MPVAHNPVLLIHCCNDIGAWGAGFVLALSKRWRLPEAAYLDWAHGCSASIYPKFELGQVQVVQVEKQIFIGNMIGQHGIGAGTDGTPPIRYDAIDRALIEIRSMVDGIGEAFGGTCEVHCPRFGAGLAGGDWTKIEQLLIKRLVEHGVLVTVYDYPQPVVAPSNKAKVVKVGFVPANMRKGGNTGAAKTKSAR